MARRPEKERTADLGAALGVFIAEHEYCGDLASVVDDERVMMTCTCGAIISRALEPARRQ